MHTSPAPFADRHDAGKQLAALLAARRFDRPVVYALPRGGVPVGLEIARALRAPLDLVMVRKIGAPGAPELALGALVEGDASVSIINQDVRAATGADAAFLAAAAARETVEIERRRALYLRDRTRISPAGHTAIVVDDGLATGATAKAALAALRRQGATHTVLAVPVAPQDAIADMRAHADDVVCLHEAAWFPGVGAFYADFHQLTDDETIALLRRAPTA
ncbi:MAG TPA: phosphoribosyltransferase family protein [Acetobacteraceae bacterium]|nr:phosphoribosyltransferase family protein [Acetobacteraceae bacterium]